MEILIYLGDGSSRIINLGDKAKEFDVNGQEFFEFMLEEVKQQGINLYDITVIQTLTNTVN